MASTGKCKFCGAAVRSDERNCPSCGAVNENYVADTPRTVFLPKTIEELKEYCAERGMPLLRMRFFIDENYQEPRAFGIYRDGDDFVVYKNKADGSRSIRYCGPDEAYAVNELFLKLLEECHNRGIYPDGKPETRSGAPSYTPFPRQKDRQTSQKLPLSLQLAISAGFILIMIFFSTFFADKHKDGYYRLPHDAIYYNIGSDWYTTIGDRWYETSAPSIDSDALDSAYLGNTIQSDWGVSNFRDSSAYRDYEERHSSDSSDYDDWDISDTDWDSDW